MAFNDGKKYVHSKQDYPKGPHLGIIEFGSYTTEGDQRSRDCPGHGYPASTQSTISYIWYPVEKRAEWEAEIRDRLESKYGNKDNWYALENGQVVTIQTSFTIGGA